MPASPHPRQLHLSAPIDRWDEAIPLGNGLMGTLLWGGGNHIKLSLDRGDLWDLRPTPGFDAPDWNWATLKRLVAEKNVAEIQRRFDDPYSTPTPTKIPGGRIELTLARGVAIDEFSLDMTKAVGAATWGNPGGKSGGDSGGKAGRVQVFCSADARVGLVHVAGSAAKIRLVPPAFGDKPSAGSVTHGQVSSLGYPPPKVGRAGAVQWSLQEAAQGFAFAIVVGSRVVRGGRGGTLIAYTLTCTNDGPDPVAIGRKLVEDALDAGFDAMLKPHARWWRDFWARSDVRLPDPAILQHYNLVRYFYGSASRRGAPPIPLQGVWTADEGYLPPWKGDYHHDLNTQLTYWAYLTPNHLDEGLCFLDFLWDMLPRGRRFAREFFDAPGACLPGVAALDGQPLGGWAQYTLVPTNSAWLAHSFYLHWRHTLDTAFLADRAYPWCSEIGTCLQALLEPTGPAGKLRLPLSASPEIHDNTLAAWMPPNTTYDLALLRWLFGDLAEMAGELGKTSEAGAWRATLDQLEELHIEKEGPWTNVLKVSATERLEETHRHHSHLLSVHPLGLVNIDDSELHRHIIKGSLAQIDKLGTGFWCGYSFAWMSCIAARGAQAERARAMLEVFVRAFIARNGFHLNGDFKNQGYSLFKYRPFTLEGNFAAGQAVHEMLLQTWGGTVRIFPAVSDEWRDVSFTNWRGEGAVLVSAERKSGRTQSVRITSERGGQLCLRDPFAGGRATWNRRGVARVGDNYVCDLCEGETLEGHTRQ